MIAQRVRHRDVVAVLDDNGRAIAHTPELITRLFDEELKRIVGELPAGMSEEMIERYTQARILSERMIVTEEFNPQ
jgi:hypothetical protein